MTTRQCYPELDSLRGLAALAVMGWHLTRELSFPTDALAEGIRVAIGFNGHGGRLGIIFFFLLSGYLITMRMLREQREGRFRFGRFMARRALRIWPLYYAVLVLGFLIIPLLTRLMGQPVTEGAPWWSYALFLANFSMIHHGDPVIGTLGVQWSVAIEEQFYLGWALLLLLVRREWLFTACIAVLAMAALAYAWSSEPRAAYFHLFGNLRYLAAGSLLGVWMAHSEERIMERVMRIPAALRGAFVVLLPLLAMALCRWAGFDPSRMAMTDGILVLGFCALLLERSCADDRVLRLDSWRVLPWLGERSYGLYLLHMPAIALARWATGAEPGLCMAAAPLAVLLSVLLAAASFRWVERPFLRLKSRFA